MAPTEVETTSHLSSAADQASALNVARSGIVPASHEVSAHGSESAVVARVLVVAAGRSALLQFRNEDVLVVGDQVAIVVGQALA